MSLLNHINWVQDDSWVNPIWRAVDIKLRDPISKLLCMIDISTQDTNSNNLWSRWRDGGRGNALICTQT